MAGHGYFEVRAPWDMSHLSRRERAFEEEPIVSLVAMGDDDVPTFEHVMVRVDGGGDGWSSMEHATLFFEHHPRPYLPSIVWASFAANEDSMKSVFGIQTVFL